MSWTEKDGTRVFSDQGWQIIVANNERGEERVRVRVDKPSKLFENMVAVVEVEDDGLGVWGAHKYGQETAPASISIPWSILRELIALRAKTTLGSKDNKTLERLEFTLKETERELHDLRKKMQDLRNLLGLGGYEPVYAEVKLLVDSKDAYYALRRDVEASMRTVYAAMQGRFAKRRITLGDIVETAHALRREVTEMHRRAQKREGIEATLARLRRTHAKEMADRLNEAHNIEGLWHKLYREGVDMLREGGIDDRIDGRENYRTGNLKEMIRRALDEIGHARGRSSK